MLFVMKGTARFEAKDINDAFLQMANHFLLLAIGEDTEVLKAGSDLHIKAHHTNERTGETPQW